MNEFFSVKFYDFMSTISVIFLPILAAALVFVLLWLCLSLLTKHPFCLSLCPGTGFKTGSATGNATVVANPVTIYVVPDNNTANFQFDNVPPPSYTEASSPPPYETLKK